MQALGDDDKADIRKTIDKDVLKKKAIDFSRLGVSEADGGLAVTGDLEMGGKSKPVDFVVTGDDGKLTAARRSSRATGASSPTRPCSAR